MSGGALKVGDVYVAVTASIGEALKSLGDLVEGVEKAAKQVKAAANDIGEIGAVVAAGIAGAVAAATQSNSDLKDEVERLTDLLYTLAADLGELFAPVVTKLTDFVERLVATFQRLSPETKQAAADMATWVASAGLAIGVLGKMAGVVEALSGGMGLLLNALGALSKSTGLASLGATLAGLAAPVAAVAAAIGALTLLAGAVYGAWTDTSTGLRESVLSILAAIGQVAARVWEVLKGTFEALGGVIHAIVMDSLNTMAWLVRETAKKLLPLADVLGMTRLQAGLKAAAGLTGEDLLKALEAGGAYVKDQVAVGAQALGNAVASLGATVYDAGKAVGQGVATGFSGALAGTKKMFEDMGLSALLERLTAMLPSLPSLSQEKADVRVKDEDQGIDVTGPAKRELSGLVKDVVELAAHGGEATRALSKAAEDKAKALARAMAEAAEAARQAIAQARESLQQRFASAFAQLVDLANVFSEGTLAAGGNPLGGVAAVVGELLTQSEGFQTLMSMVSTILQRVADALGKVLEPLQPLLGAISLIIDAILSALTPLFEMLGEVIKPLVPPLVLVGQLLQGLAPLLEAAGRAFMAITMPLAILGGPVMKALFEVLKFVSQVILRIAQALGSVWNGIVGAVQSVIRSISKAVDWLGIDALKDFANDLDDLKVDTDAMGDALNALADTTWDSAEATAENAAENLRNADALRRANEALTNVPNAWKVALRRFQVQDAQEGPTVEPTPRPSTGGGGARPPLPDVDTGGGGLGGIMDRLRETADQLAQMFPPAAPTNSVFDRLRETADQLAQMFPPSAPSNPFARLHGALAGLSTSAPSPPSAPAAEKAGDTYNVNITGMDIREAVNEGARFVERQRTLLGKRISGRVLQATTKYA
jgi:phage-related protein